MFSVFMFYDDCEYLLLQLVPGENIGKIMIFVKHSITCIFGNELYRARCFECQTLQNLV